MLGLFPKLHEAANTWKCSSWVYNWEITVVTNPRIKVADNPYDQRYLPSGRLTWKWKITIVLKGKPQKSSING